MLGTTPGTLRKWENTGELLPFRKTAEGIENGNNVRS
jgi:DNA-binding transcriptional MerR regulator